MRYTPGNWRYKLNDGRIFNSAIAKFTTEEEAQEWAKQRGIGRIPDGPYDEKGESSAEGLRQELARFGLPLGELLGLEESRAAALARLNVAFAAAEASGKVMSSAGFVIDATERSNRDIEGLITIMEATSTPEAAFCAADNSFHTVTLEQLRTMRLEVIAYGQALYARKWELRAAIESAESVAEVQVVDINFDGVSA